MTYAEYAAAFNLPSAADDELTMAQRDAVVTALRAAMQGLQQMIDSNPKGSH